MKGNTRRLVPAVFKETDTDADGTPLAGGSQHVDMTGRGRDLSGQILLFVVVVIILFAGFAGMNALMESSTVETGDPLYNATDQFVADWTDAAFLAFGVCAGVIGVILTYLYRMRGGR